MSDIVSIVSGGPSASEVNLAELPGKVIGVNNAALHMPRIDAAITMDRRWSEAHWPFFFQNNGAIELWLRPNNIMNLKKRPEWKPSWVHVYQCDHKQVVMSDIPGQLNGNNSGHVAVNLGYALNPKRLYLFGFDYRPGRQREMHWFAQGETGRVGDYPIHETRYRGWAAQFDYTAAQFRAKGIDVAIVSDISLIKCFRRISPKDFMKGAR